MESVPYSEAELTDEVVYSDATHKIRKLWKWNVNSLYEDGETGLLKVLISGQAFNWYGKSVFVSIDGKRLTSLTFDIIDNFQEGLARVAVSGYGYGFVNKDMNLVIPMKYDEAESFKDGKAKVRRGDKWIFIDKMGQELELGGSVHQEEYQEVGNYFEGMCRVSTFKLRFMDLAYHSDNEHIAGTWGFVNEAGKEVIPPQYIYANDFEDGMPLSRKASGRLTPNGIMNTIKAVTGRKRSFGVRLTRMVKKLFPSSSMRSNISATVPICSWCIMAAGKMAVGV